MRWALRFRRKRYGAIRPECRARCARSVRRARDLRVDEAGDQARGPLPPEYLGNRQSLGSSEGGEQAEKTFFKIQCVSTDTPVLFKPKDTYMYI